MLLQHVVVPVGVVGFCAFLHVEVTADGGWPLLAVAGVVWLLFANAVLQGGMALWHERRLLEGVAVPPWLLVAGAAVVPVAVFVVQLAITALAITAPSTDYRVPAAGLVAPATIALACGLGVGVLAARLCTVRPGVVAAVPGLVLVSLLLTPVLYPLSALGGAGDPWCTVNPLCTATELARADVADGPFPLPDAAVVVAVVASIALVAWGLLAIRRPRPSSVPRPSEPALRMVAVDSGGVDGPPRRRVDAVLTRLAEAVGPRRAGHLPRAEPPRLRDVHLTIARGDVVAVVGAPESGQTPLLRIAAGLRRPTRGTVAVDGAPSSLLDPRSGVHTALGLRENLVLRGLVEGLPVARARARADDILRFAELADHAATPVHRCSDETLVRLAFGAMAFLTAHVVVWDDDVLRRFPRFRQQCLGLVPTLLAEGRSILIASGDLGKIGEISPRAVWLDHGEIRADGPTPAVLDAYLAPRVATTPVDTSGTVPGPCRVVAVEMLDDRGEPATAYRPGDPITVALELELAEAIACPYLVVGIAGESGPIAAASMFLDGNRPASLSGRARIECRFEGPTLAPRHAFTVRFAMYASDGTTVLVPKHVVADFVTGGTAADCGFSDTRAAGRVLGSAPVLPTYRWRLPGDPESASGPDVAPA